ncbi:MAG: family 43 glycosylhydrolase, partial [Bacteroidales bacterium]|nr:family 43 glycosylhydrolase [Bacteroidales bacterium]
CWVAVLNPDMASFATERKEITPERYFEGPWMIKHEGTYYLTYSEGKTIEDSYEVRYATSDSPFGPFTQGANSPILTKDSSLQVYGPGHHTIVQLQGQHFILYHKHGFPSNQYESAAFRCKGKANQEHCAGVERENRGAGWR